MRSDYLRFISLVLDDLSDDQEIRDLQILQLQKIIDLEIIIEEANYETVHRRT